MAQDFNAPPGAPGPARSGNRTVLIIILVLVLLCCCGVALIAWLYYYGGDWLLGLSQQILHLLV
jgi:flagellar basal body-associated protein FliL